MSRLVTNLESLAQQEGYTATSLPGVGVFRASESSGRGPLCYSQGILVVAQGHKRVYLDDQVYNYNADNYLVLTLPLPAECETLVDPGKPLLSMMIDLHLPVLNELVRKFDEHGRFAEDHLATSGRGLYVSECSQSFSDAILRLSDCLQSPLQADVMGPGLVREVLFHILSGPQSAPLFALVSHNTHLSRLDRVLKHLHTHFDEHLDVEQLAGMANMSPSTFHRNFKEVTASSPIQYVKKIRLNRARELLQDQGVRVKQAAAEVGYESATQFSREFSRYFGQSPREVGREVEREVAS